VCFFLTIATPLTLSEIRSMLPSGLAAQPVSAVEAAALRQLLPATATAASLLVGGCSCDLVRRRDQDPREDERLLRERYFRLGLAREQVIRELERHRRRSGPVQPFERWSRALADFVGEHARNAGPTLYHLRFGPAGPLPEGREMPAVTRTVAEVHARPEGWLEEDRAVLVVR